MARLQGTMPVTTTRSTPEVPLGKSGETIYFVRQNYSDYLNLSNRPLRLLSLGK